MSKAFNRIWARINWLFDDQKAKVPEHLQNLYRHIFLRTFQILGEKPDIFEGQDLNNKIKWLMLFDQGEDIVTCSDKIAVRDYVSEKIGEKYLTKLYGTWANAEEIDFDHLPKAFVLKTNHDSGSVWIVEDKEKLDVSRLLAEVATKLKRTYAFEKGEWQYRHIKPRVFAEELLPSESGGIPDFKFHCATGKVKFVQYVYNRRLGVPSEQIILPNGDVTSFNLGNSFQRGNEFSKPKRWNELITLAEKLSKPFKYVRVDLYCSYDEIHFGELTFFPRNGNYQKFDQAELGRWIELDRSTTRSYASGNAA